MTVREIEPGDIPACRELYNYYIENTTFSFETEPVSLEEFTARVERISESYPYLVCEEEGRIAGFCYLDRFSERGAYRFTCDLSVYVEKDSRGSGIGSAMTREILSRAKAMGLKTVVSVITGGNTASEDFHRKMGFELTASLPDVGCKFGKWLGISYYLYRL